jgi:hypothetical protein
MRPFFLSIMFISSFAISQSWIVSTSPQRYSAAATEKSSFTITVSQTLLASSVTSSTVILNGSESGYHTPVITVAPDAKSFTLSSSRAFTVGENVYITLTTGIKNSDGTAMPKAETWYCTVAAHFGSGSFAVASTQPTFYGPWLPIAADLDNDGDPDIVTVCNNSDGNDVNKKAVTFYRNDRGAGGSYTMTLVGHLPIYGDLMNGVTGDFDKDSDLDVIVTDLYQRRIIFLRNNGGMNFTENGYFNIDTRGARTIAANDLDGDGDLDLAVGSQLSSQIFFLRNNGAFSFTAASSVNDATESERIIMEDLDGDGDPDLLAGNINWESVVLYENTGDLTFVKKPTIDPGFKRSAPSAADLDNDGDLDIVLNSENYLSPAAAVLQNNGTFSFTVKDTFSFGGHQSKFTQLADLDANGFRDIITASPGNPSSLQLRMNAGGFSFTAGKGIPTGISTSPFATTDIDGDGDLDIIQSNYNENSFTIYRQSDPSAQLLPNRTELRFARTAPGKSTETTLVLKNIGAGESLVISNIAAADPAFSVTPLSGTVKPGDSLTVKVTFIPGKTAAFLDSLLISSNDAKNPLQIVRLFGTTRYITSVSPALHSIAAQPLPKISMIFSGDIDLATAEISSFIVHGSVSGKHSLSGIIKDAVEKKISLTLTTAFSPGERVTVTVLPSMKTTQGSPLPEPFVWMFTAFARRAGAAFTSAPSVTASSPFNEWQSTASADLDNDGKSDLIIPGYSAGAVRIYKSTGGMAFTLSANVPSVSSARFAACGDLDLDGDADIAVCQDAGGSVHIIRNDGNFSFTSMGTITSGGTGTQYVHITDLNGDGFPDIALAHYSSGDVSILFGNGAFGFSSPVTLPAPAVKLIESADMDGDGDIDLLAGRSEQKNFTLIRNDGEKVFNTVPLLSISSYIRSAAVRDFNNDAAADIVAGNDNAGAFTLLTNDGNNTFIPVNMNGGGVAPLWLDAGDIDGDGDADVVTTNNGYGEKGTYYLNTLKKGSDQFVRRGGFSNEYANYISLYDYNGDGDLDASVAEVAGSMVKFFSNADWNAFSEMRALGVVKKGATVQFTFAVCNYGSRPLTVTGIVPSGSFIKNVTPGSGVIAGGDSLIITMDVLMDHYGDETGWLTVNTDDPEFSNKSFQLTVSSLAPLPVVNKYSILFEQVGLHDSAAVAVRISNKSADPVIIDSMYTAMHRFGVRYTPAPVTRTDTMTFAVTFKADSIGYFTDTLVIVTSVPPMRITVPISGSCPNANTFISPYPNFGVTYADSVKLCTVKIYNFSPTSTVVDTMYVLTPLFSLSHFTPHTVLTKNDTVVFTLSFSPDTAGIFRDTLFIGFRHLSAPYRIPLTASSIILHVERISSAAPETWYLHDPYPNPFNPSTTISFGVPSEQFVSVKIYDLIGREHAVLVSERLRGGKYSIRWNAAGAASGVYLCRMQAGQFVRTKKISLLK